MILHVHRAEAICCRTWQAKGSKKPLLASLCCSHGGTKRCASSGIFRRKQRQLAAISSVALRLVMFLSLSKLAIRQSPSASLPRHAEGPTLGIESRRLASRPICLFLFFRGGFPNLLRHSPASRMACPERRVRPRQAGRNKDLGMRSAQTFHSTRPSVECVRRWTGSDNLWQE